MKLHFEPDLDYQRDAIEAVCGLFKGQEAGNTTFTISPRAAQQTTGFAQGDLGVGNNLLLSDDAILKNLRDVQMANGLPPAEKLESGDFTVEMETGTGKTYVYLRTIFELNKRYGFTKFVIVVPTVAIKEGVYKTLQITAEHFRGLYSGAPFEYFLYDSSKPGQVRVFAAGATIQIMVVTVGAVNKKDVNNLYKDTEKAGGEKPIDLIKATHPIIIVDEPQSVDGGLEGRGKEALAAMNPLCTLRYSATHADAHHMVYRLDAVDACERKLVKQIEVAGATIEGAHNKAYVRVASVQNKRKVISARLELDVQGAFGVQRDEVTVQDGDDLRRKTRRELYDGWRVGEISVKQGQEYVELRHGPESLILKPGEAVNDVDPPAVAREMIRRTIREHLDKEMKLRPRGIKVLSLFFVSRVADYRVYADDGTATKGVLAAMFEEEYARAARLPKYRTLFEGADLGRAAQEVHDGYFSIDRKGGWTDTGDGNATGREAAERAYNLIMKDKEKLLSLDTPLKFIFSHSALREGWDNPNVFQICVLRDVTTERQRRQTLGRGLRLCVNQQGQRVRGFEVNTLTVVAGESYETFAHELQKEIERDTGIRFGVVERDQFAGMTMKDANGAASPLGSAKSQALWQHLHQHGYIDVAGKVQGTLRAALKDGTLTAPEGFAGVWPRVTAALRKLAGSVEVKDADERRSIKARKAVLLSPEFQALWERIKYRSTYRVNFDNERLIRKSTAALQNMPPIPAASLQWRVGEVAIGRGGVEAVEREGAATITLEEGDIVLPDLLTEMQDRTGLTRKTLHGVLTACGRLESFRQNPQAFIDNAARAINDCKRMELIDGIKYQRLGDEHYYAQELFEDKELTGYLKNMARACRKSVFKRFVCDSDVERKFADDMEKHDAVKLYAKLPAGFVVPTPLGNYNPDWAVLIEENGAERLYFVAETKGDLFGGNLRPEEDAKIKCGERHFKAIATGDNPARYVRVKTVTDMLSHGG